MSVCNNVSVSIATQYTEKEKAQKAPKSISSQIWGMILSYLPDREAIESAHINREFSINKHKWSFLAQVKGFNNVTTKEQYQELLRRRINETAVSYLFPNLAEADKKNFGEAEFNKRQAEINKNRAALLSIKNPIEQRDKIIDKINQLSVKPGLVFFENNGVTDFEYQDTYSDAAIAFDFLLGDASLPNEMKKQVARIFISAIEKRWLVDKKGFDDAEYSMVIEACLDHKLYDIFEMILRAEAHCCDRRLEILEELNFRINPLLLPMVPKFDDASLKQFLRIIFKIYPNFYINCIPIINKKDEEYFKETGRAYYFELAHKFDRLIPEIEKEMSSQLSVPAVATTSSGVSVTTTSTSSTVTGSLDDVD